MDSLPASGKKRSPQPNLTYPVATIKHTGILKGRNTSSPKQAIS